MSDTPRPDRLRAIAPAGLAAAADQVAEAGGLIARFPVWGASGRTKLLSRPHVTSIVRPAQGPEGR